ncbi:class I SAM-dependent methyltransferase [Phreatobacter sp.]|uniref:class I SAM-dependent methyltransferase n=1 Tax=Phreatobacter sp. TaxID=1966341 RepID=UPI003F6FAD98
MSDDIEALRARVAESDRLYAKQDLPGAIALLRPLIEAQVKYFRPYFNLGFFSWLQADYATARDMLAQAVELAPNFADARMFLAKAQIASRDHAPAIEQIDAYLALGGKDRTVQLWRARALWGLARMEEAARAINDYAAALGWATPRQDGLTFAQEPWFLAHVPNWCSKLGPILGKVDRALEIGSMEGMSAVWIAEHLLSPKGQLIVNDIEFRPNLISNLSRSRHGRRIELTLGDSAEVLPALPPAQFDFIYVDGDHSAAGVFRDCINAIVVAKPGASIVLDDYGKANESTRAGIDLFLQAFAPCVEVVAKEYQVFLRRSLGAIDLPPRMIKTLAKSLTPQSAKRLTAADVACVLQLLRQGAAIPRT